MKITSAFVFTSLSLLAGLAAQLASAHPGDGALLRARRTMSMLGDFPGLSPLVNAEAVSTASLDVHNIQADVLVGMQKKKETFLFFKIDNVAKFKSVLHDRISHQITSVHRMLATMDQPMTAINLAFSHSGLAALGINDDLGDPLFTAGQEADANTLGDPGTQNWEPAFKGTQVHGVFILISDNDARISEAADRLKDQLGGSITVLHSIAGSARPGKKAGHEYFGFKDGISQPGVIGFTKSPVPGQQMLKPGIFLLGEDGDKISRPAWAKDGTFMAFRKLKQLVPEFNRFLLDNAIVESGVRDKKHGAALLGARMVGRWPSGAPTDIAPLYDDPVLGADTSRNNHFSFAHPNEDLNSDQKRCPFSAHIRKNNPRFDFKQLNTDNHIIRAGTPYGLAVSPSEKASGRTSEERGLAFVAYQSDITQGFHRLQAIWSNNPNFFPNKAVTPGFDPIGGANNGKSRMVAGLDPKDPTRNITFMTDFVASQGGEYFFVPPLSAIRGKLSV